MASAAKVRSKKLAANKDRLNRLLAELEELCVGSADVYEIEEQISMTEEIYRASDALQAELELDLEGEERKVLEFPTFWAQFEASIHNRSDLDAATKFTYLISSTVGMARSSIEGIPLTEANYPQAVGILKARFGRPRLVVREHLAALWKAPVCCEMSMRGIQSLVYEVTKHLRCLAALDKDPFAGPLPLNEDNLQKFLEFAQWQANLLAKPMEEDNEKQVGETEHRTSLKKLSRSTWKSGGRVTSSAAALAVAATGSCPFCEGEHKGADCQKCIKANLPSRMAMVRAKGVCFKCLEIGHQVRDCRESRPCAVDGCGRAHHKLLHSSTPRESARSTESSSVQRGMLAKGNGKGACLQIVRSRAYGPDGTHVAVNCLLDTGAQVSSQIEYLKISLETFRIATYCFPELSELLSVLFIIFAMADIPVLCLVPNCNGSMALVFEGRSYKLKYTGKQKKCWRCSKDKKGCKGAVWTDLEVTAVINRKDHVETCQVDEHLAYKMEKKALLKKRSADEMKPIPAIYDEEASAASAEPSTSGHFPVGIIGSTEKRVKVNGLYEVLQLLIAEQGVMDTLIQQVPSINATVGDLRRTNSVYAEKQQRIAQYTGEYTDGRRTLEL
ncbi:hypothetical protein T10_5792 [Trichinella papuae]|uniref:CCHC-type domain-containing protein n=2 Tax=Trichinella TaxID=6333 RepID=A0A0V1N3C4_9BILA|nr:hypothetical protein T10_5792 [Trichinella papuae]